MRNSLRFGALTALAFALAQLFCVRPANAIPIFAQRYRLSCDACHTVIPELNAFGRSFRAQGYRLPITKHGTTILAIRYQNEYEKDPPTGQRRFQGGGIVLGNEDFGKITAFIHYNLGAAGGPSALFLGYLATYNQHTQSLYRFGLFELPLPQSPGQRLDDLQQYGYYGTHVGLNDLPLSSPRWGVEAVRKIGVADVHLVADVGEFKGAAYGGVPIPTGETTSAATPEVGLFAYVPVVKNVTLGLEGLAGKRDILLTGGKRFDDFYERGALFAHGEFGRFDLQGEQWLGRDANADGFGTAIGSSGGYFRVKYYPTPHSYLGIRYDTAATPAILRDVVYYVAFQVTPPVRFLVQQVQTIGGAGHFGGAITVAFPPPLKL